MRPCKDHLALEEGALPKAAELCIAIPGNVDKEHFILENTPAIGAFHLPFPSNWLDSELAVYGTRKAIQRGLVIKERLQLSNHNKTHSCALVWTLMAKILLSSERAGIWNDNCISGRKPGLQCEQKIWLTIMMQLYNETFWVVCFLILS